MEFGPYQLQIFVSLVVILGAAFVALICDFLKGNNEQLRELTIELKVRREEEQRRSQTMPAREMAAPALAMAAAGPSMTSDQIEVPTRRSMATPKERKRMPSSDALAAMERGAQLAATPQVQSPAAERIKAAAAARAMDEMVIAQTAAAPAVEIETERVEAPRTTITMTPRKKDWNSLLLRRAEQKQVIEHVAETIEQKPAGLLDAVVAATNTQREQETTQSAEFPAGFHDGFILSRLVHSRRPVSGLVVSIGVNTPRKADGSMPDSVLSLIQSLIGAEDFACQSSAEEFLLIYPNERGASAQRKLSQVAQQLWDFQLRSLGTFSILFSWGGVEVRSESIEEAIASANERMQETRRGRKLLTMEPRHEVALRQAV